MTEKHDTVSLYENGSMKIILSELAGDELREFDAWNQIPHEYPEGFIHQICRKEKKVPSAFRKGRRVMIFIAAAIVLVLTACAAIEPIRKAIITWHEKYVGLLFVSDTSDDYPIVIEERILPPLDEGWRIDVIISTQVLGCYRFTSPYGSEIFYDQQVYKPDEIKMDNTGCVIDEITVNDVKAYICVYNEGGYVSLMWEDKYLFSLSSEQESVWYLIEILEDFYS